MKISAVFPAAGSGLRFGEKKQLKLLGNRPLLFHAIRPFLDLDPVLEIIVAVQEEDVTQTERELKSLISTKPVQVIPGGARRQDSVSEGLKAASNDADYICIHDAVRPFVTPAIIQSALDACPRHDGVIVSEPAKDTIKQIDGDQIIATLPREEIHHAQTPQIFSKPVLKEALDLAIKDDIYGTDEAFLAERLGYQIGIVNGSPLNIKITTTEDWLFAEAIYKSKFFHD